MKLDELEQLEKAATLAPWTATTDRYGDYLVTHGETAVCDLLDSTLAAQQDAVLIAAARNALPALLRVARAALYVQGAFNAPVDRRGVLENAPEALAELSAALEVLER